MRALGLLSASLLFLLVAGQGAEAQAACSSVRDPAGNVRLRCSDGTTGTLRNNGTGVLSGRVGDRNVRARENTRPAQDSIRGAGRQGSSGRGGVSNNSTTGGSNCMSGGLRMSDCN